VIGAQGRSDVVFKDVVTCVQGRSDMCSRTYSDGWGKERSCDKRGDGFGLKDW
jgi:hypothetical protein